MSLWAQLRINYDHHNADYQRIIAHLCGFMLATSQGSQIAHYQTVQPAWRGHGNRWCYHPINGLRVILRARWQSLRLTGNIAQPDTLCDRAGVTYKLDTNEGMEHIPAVRCDNSACIWASSRRTKGHRESNTVLRTSVFRAHLHLLVATGKTAAAPRGILAGFGVNSSLPLMRDSDGARSVNRLRGRGNRMERCIRIMMDDGGGRLTPPRTLCDRRHARAWRMKR